MQNKPNVKYAQINVNSYMKSKYEKLDTWLSGQNKPNSNPIKPNLKKAKMNVNLYIIEDYENETAFRPKKTNPIQTLFKPNLVRRRRIQKRPKSLAGKSGHTRQFLSAFFYCRKGPFDV